VTTEYSDKDITEPTAKQQNYNQIKRFQWLGLLLSHSVSPISAESVLQNVLGKSLVILQIKILKLIQMSI
jgi:hypothetical protein